MSGIGRDLGNVNVGNYFQQTYMFEIWRRRLITPCRSNFGKNLGSSKMLGGDMTAVNNSAYPPNHQRGPMIIQNQLLGDGSVKVVKQNESRFTVYNDYAKWLVSRAKCEKQLFDSRGKLLSDFGWFFNKGC